MSSPNVRHRFTVLFTHQKTQKTKRWQDGVLLVKYATKPPTDSSRLRVSCSLYDECNTLKDSFSHNRDVAVGDELESELFLITVENQQEQEQEQEQEENGNRNGIDIGTGNDPSIKSISNESESQAKLDVMVGIQNKRKRVGEKSIIGYFNKAESMIGKLKQRENFGESKPDPIGMKNEDENVQDKSTFYYDEKTCIQNNLKIVENVLGRHVAERRVEVRSEQTPTQYHDIDNNKRFSILKAPNTPRKRNSQGLYACALENSSDLKNGCRNNESKINISEALVSDLRTHTERKFLLDQIRELDFKEVIEILDQPAKASIQWDAKYANISEISSLQQFEAFLNDNLLFSSVSPELRSTIMEWFKKQQKIVSVPMKGDNQYLELQNPRSNEDLRSLLKRDSIK